MLQVRRKGNGKAENLDVCENELVHVSEAMNETKEVNYINNMEDRFFEIDKSRSPAVEYAPSWSDHRKLNYKKHKNREKCASGFIVKNLNNNNNLYSSF